MTSLPTMVHRAPRILYGLAILFFVWSMALTVSEINMTMSYVEPGNPVVRQAMLRGLYQAALEAVYIGANGVLAQILIAIWLSGTRPAKEGDE